MSVNEPKVSVAVVAACLAARLSELRHDYALGGALALGYWGAPRGTVDVDITLYLPADRPGECLQVLHEVGCEFYASEAIQSLREHGFCRVTLQARAVDVFLPIVPFYEIARERRQQVNLGSHRVFIWDAESLAVFKMMFFRPKDRVDLAQILEYQGDVFDRDWVRQQLAAMYGARDPRLSAWDELVREATTEKP